jgi:hypothetical protein
VAGRLCLLVMRNGHELAAAKYLERHPEKYHHTIRCSSTNSKISINLKYLLLIYWQGKSPILLAGDDDQARMISRARAQHISATDMATKVRTMRPLGVWRGRCFTELLDFAGRRAQPPAADRSRHRLAELRHRLAELT